PPPAGGPPPVADQETQHRPRGLQASTPSGGPEACSPQLRPLVAHLPHARRRNPPSAPSRPPPIHAAERPFGPIAGRSAHSERPAPSVPLLFSRETHRSRDVSVAEWRYHQVPLGLVPLAVGLDVPALA